MTSTTAPDATAAASPVPPATAAPRQVLIWDMPVRVFHWLLALSFFGAYLTAESERWRLVHVTLGYTLAGLVVFRVVWGLIGTRHARFADFVRGPRAVKRYLGALAAGRPEHHVGHNPAGALAIVAMLALGALIAGSGWALYNEIGGARAEDLLEGAHELAANLMMGVVVVHVIGVLLASWMHRENLVGAMFSGRKPATPDEGIRSAWHTVAVIMLVAVLGFWWQQWQTAPTPELASATSQSAPHRGDHDGDDD
jgi:cytochrome b